ncbi:unnamed protein product [Mytilus coruscus]|uniref:Uncharacterized protein n=1 Tax=Mytilus coruscus TaxID=42192 RepID=A0A6J8ERS1_MYTCO|nr:unnamed protein product [Mytilus coruscus]
MTAVYFFCDNVSDDLHDTSSFIIDKIVRDFALVLQGNVLLAKLSAGDAEEKTHKESQESVIHGIVLSEIIEYIDGTRSGTDIVPISKLVDHAKLYSNPLEQLGVVMEGRIDTSHLKNWNVAVIADLQAYKQGRLVLLIFNEGVREALKQATS